MKRFLFLYHAHATPPYRNNFKRLWVAHISFHSLAHAVNPRLKNESIPRAVLICPNTGSGIIPRFLYSARPRFVLNFRSISSRSDKPFGILPLGGGCIRLFYTFDKIPLIPSALPHLLRITQDLFPAAIPADLAAADILALYYIL